MCGGGAGWRVLTLLWSVLPLCSEVLRQKEFEFSQRHTSKNIFKFHVLLTTYQALVHDWEHLAHIHWRAVTIDEAHNLRNRDSQILQVRGDGPRW